MRRIFIFISDVGAQNSIGIVAFACINACSCNQFAVFFAVGQGFEVYPSCKFRSFEEVLHQSGAVVEADVVVGVFIAACAFYAHGADIGEISCDLRAEHKGQRVLGEASVDAYGGAALTNKQFCIL